MKQILNKSDKICERHTVKNIKHYGKIKFYLKNCRKIYFHGSEDNIFKIPVSPKLNYKFSVT